MTRAGKNKAKSAAISTAAQPQVTTKSKPLIDQLPVAFAGALTSLAVLAPLLPFDTAPSQWNNVLSLMLWLLVVMAWALAGVAKGRFVIRLDATTIAVLLLTLWPAISALVLIQGQLGDARLAANLASQWLGFGVLFFFARQLLKTARDVRLLAAIMLATCAALSMLALSQYFYTMPQLRAQYQANRAAMRAEAGLAGMDDDAPQLRHFEDRLSSVEPTATFALTNSLAGLLTPWLVLAVGLGVRMAGDPAQRRQLLLFAPLVLLLLAVLILTKSRTAALATMAGAALVAVYATPLGKRIDARIPLALGFAAVLLVIGGVVSGGLDVQVLSEAPKSVLYRLQYWQATAGIIRDHFWFGCGPGNFQTTYLAYQLPEASENIADPHNFILEIWANFGTPALLALLGVVGCCAWQVWRGRAAGVINDDQKHLPDRVPPESRLLTHGVAALVGVALAYGAGFVSGLEPDRLLVICGLPVAVGVVMMLRDWIDHGELPTGLLVAAIVALLINLLAAGGIGFPGVTTSLWLLVAMVLTQVDANTHRQEMVLSRPLAIGVLVVILLASVVYHRAVYNPVLRGLAVQAQAFESLGNRRVDEAIKHWEEAARLDPYAFAPWEQLAAIWHAQLVQNGEDAGARRRFDEACAEAVARDPRSPALHSNLGHWQLEQYRRLGDDARLAEAIVQYQAALLRNPHNALRQGQYAWALHLAGREREASDVAERALLLDQSHEHQEYKLAKLQLRDFPVAAGLKQLPPAKGAAEPLLAKLRKAEK